MSKPSPRDIILKIRVNPDEYLSYRDKCAALGIPVAAAARALINADVALAASHQGIGGRSDVLIETNLISEIEVGKGPAQGPRRAVRFPSKPTWAKGKTVVRLRL